MVIFMNKSDDLIYDLSIRTTIFIFIYYWMIMIISGIIAIIIGFNSIKNNIAIEQTLKYAFIVSISISGMLCCVQYIKRLYKACITERIQTTECSLKKIGNLVYFLSRPFFAFVFSILLVFSLLSGMFIVTGNLSYFLNEKFIYLCAILSGILGFSIGKILDKFNTISKEKINQIL